jgi:hypothetical protein
LSQDAAAAAADVLRYRRIRDECLLNGIQLVITEAGQAAPGWKQRGTPDATYLQWMKWFDARLDEDAQIAGATLYQFGDRGTLANFDLTSLSSDLATYLSQSTSACDAGCAGPSDGGTGDAGARQDGGGPGSGVGPPGPSSGSPDTGFNTCGCHSASAGGLAALLPAALALSSNRRRRRAS